LTLLKVATECNLKIGIVTSNMSYLAAAWVNRLNIESNIDIIIGGDTVNLGKPHPEPYLSALQQTRCLASRSFAVEDSLTGIRAADAAGLKSFFLSDVNDPRLHNTINVKNLDEVSSIILSSYQNGF
ncbi:HAD family hydrolase, partial [Elstera litoralis]|uniref:HAD family hydrolase n=1 Tax=Elstera litoralis TaxID=552518 RepID=UPI0012ECDB12